MILRKEGSIFKNSAHALEWHCVKFNHGVGLGPRLLKSEPELASVVPSLRLIIVLEPLQVSAHLGRSGQCVRGVQPSRARISRLVGGGIPPRSPQSMFPNFIQRTPSKFVCVLHVTNSASSQWRILRSRLSFSTQAGSQTGQTTVCFPYSAPSCTQQLTDSFQSRGSATVRYRNLNGERSIILELSKL